MARSIGLAQQTVSLPTGGAIRRIGENFCPDPFTGSGRFSVPVHSSADRDNCQPDLTLTYSAGNGNGYCGLGWQVSTLGIVQTTERDDDFAAAASFGGELVVSDLTGKTVNRR